MFDLVFEKSVKVDGASIVPYTANGYQLSVWSKVYPFEGTCDIHLIAVDVTDTPSADTSYVMAEKVTRHYGELHVVCESIEVKEYWETLLVDAKRTYVILFSEFQTRAQSNFDESMQARQAGEAWDQSDFLWTSKLELQEVERLNSTANAELRKSMENRFFDPFPFAQKLSEFKES